MLQLTRPAVTTPQDWLTEGATPERGRSVEADVAPPLEEAWVYDADAGFGNVSPLLLGDVVLVATRQGEVHGINLATGKREGSSEFGEAVEGTPVVQDGILYVPNAWGRKTLFAYDLRHGRTLWKSNGTPVEAGLLLLDGTLYAADVEGVLRAIDAANGEVLWEEALDTMTTIHAAPLRAGEGRIVVADDRGRVRALSTEQEERFLWQQELEAPVYSTPAADENTVYIPTTRGQLFALDAAQGHVRWHYAIEDATVRFTAPALSGTDLVLAGTDGVVRMLDAETGDVRWTYQAKEAITAPPLFTRDVIYIGTMGKKLYALDRATGELLWEEELRGRIKSGMAAREGYLVVLTEPSHVYLFKTKTSDYVTSQ
ncbi:MAG: PQQ-binding-like beta-propeller repeat protein [Rhodothermales bacterium]